MGFFLHNFLVYWQEIDEHRDRDDKFFFFPYQHLTEFQMNKLHTKFYLTIYKYDKNVYRVPIMYSSCSYTLTVTCGSIKLLFSVEI